MLERVKEVEVGQTRHLAWLEALKAFALFGILWNHTVEALGPGPWFTNPTNHWPALAVRLHTWFPGPGSPLPRLAQFLGWLGDSGPGVFILASGFGLTLSALRRGGPAGSWGAFLRRRLARLFPLYIAMHLVVLALALGVPGSTARLDDPRTLLSLAGLRFSPGLFFYLVPAWWFVWLILQLYVVFPACFRLLQRAGIARFLAVTIGFTLACRALGLLFSANLYYWMTGLFFGTRLAEFAAGMALAAWLVQGKRSMTGPFRASRVLAAGLPVYVLGVAASLFWWGTLVSNLLVTLGLAAVFYVAWALARRVRGAERVMVQVGALAFPVFLLHQPLVDWTGAFVAAPLPHLAAAAGMLVLSFPAGWAVERAALAAIRLPRSWPASRWARVAMVAATLAMLALLAEPFLAAGEWSQRAWALGLGLGVLALAGAEAARSGRGGMSRWWTWSAGIAALVQLFILPAPAGLAAMSFGLLAAGGAILLRRLRGGTLLPLAAGGVLALVAWGAAELALTRLAPVEAGAWGELPALMTHPTRTYGLRPDRVTRLRYNNYDYVLRSNSRGLPGPEIPLARPDSATFRLLAAGDAFTMPEGLPYQDGYPALLERHLSRCLAPRTVQVIDAGITGYGPAESLPQIRELAPEYRPDLVLYQFFVNEFGEATLTPAQRREAIGLARGGSRRGYYWGRSQVARRLERAEDALRERITGRAAAWRYSRSLLAYYRRGENPLYDERHRRAVAGDLAAMRAAAEKSGAAFAVVFVPGAVAVAPPGSLAYFPRGKL